MGSTVDYPEGLFPYRSRQDLLHHTYSPVVSLEATNSADSLVREVVQQGTSVLKLLTPYGNNSKYEVPNQSFKITSTQLITKTYPSFPIRFAELLPDLLQPLGGGLSKDSAEPMKSTVMPQRFSISKLEILLKHLASSNCEIDLYTTLFQKIITSNQIVPFETFNHPISHIFVINYHEDSIDSLRKKVVEFRNYNFPKYFQLEDLLFHVFVFYRSSDTKDSDIIESKNHIEKNLNVDSTFIPFGPLHENEQMVLLYKQENSTIDQELEAVTSQKSSENTLDDYLRVPLTLDTALRLKIFNFINKNLIPHMEKKIRFWDDQVLGPRKSITSRFFTVSRKLFNNSESSGLNSDSYMFNVVENYYHKSSPEQTLRKLADWSLILKDFKYAYSTYDLIKKSYITDKAWVYVASAQEMCIVSLLLAQTQKINQANAQLDKNTLRKVKIDIIIPYMDNLSYTYKSRLNLRSYDIKVLLIVIELLLCMCVAFNNAWWWNDLIEKYLGKCIKEFDTHLSTGNIKLQAIRAILFERLGYSTGKGILLGGKNLSLVDLSPLSSEEQEFHQKEKAQKEEEDGFYKNHKKLTFDKNSATVGLTRYRKSSLWYLVSIREWLALDDIHRIKFLMRNMRLTFNMSQITDNWYDREALLINTIKNVVKDP